MNSFDISVWVTRDCNLKCDYCYEGSDKSKVYMSVKVADDILIFVDKFFNLHKPEKCNIHFHGGEPLLNPDIIWYLIDALNKKYFNRSTLNYSITTNGTIMNNSIKEKLVSLVNDISFSLDGEKYTTNAHRKYRNNRGVFDIAIKNLWEIFEDRKDIAIRMTITPEMVPYLYDNIIYFIKLGVRKILPQIDYHNKLWTKDKMDQYYLNLCKVRKYINSLDVNQFEISLVSYNPLIARGKCLGGISSFQIDPLGNLYPCSAVVGNPEYICGDLIDGVKYEWISQINKINSLNNEECHSCTFAKYCITSRCKIMNKVLTGYFNKPSEIICSIENIRYKMNCQF